MKWFFALNEGSPGFWEYVNLVQVAVFTALQRTKLQPVFIFDGGENALTAWLRAAGVQVVFRRTLLAKMSLPLSAIARGAYLRLEIPAIIAEHGWKDDYVLYTDCDVLFARDPVPLLRDLRPRYFAVAPESDAADRSNFNSGVMLINVRALSHEIPRLVELVCAQPADCLSSPYDQRAFQLHFADTADLLPRELNWKSYWSRNPSASIIHFHGPKPAQRYLLLNRLAPPDLLTLANRNYFAWCGPWDQQLLDAHDSVPFPEIPSTAQTPEGFCGIEGGIEGFGVEEGPFPLWGLPVVRWGFHPRTIVRLSTTAAATRRLSLCVQCPYAEQRMHLSLNGTHLRTVVFERVSDPVTVRLVLHLQPGDNTLGFEFERNFPQVDDPRPLAVLFRALRIDPGE